MASMMPEVSTAAMNRLISSSSSAPPTICKQHESFGLRIRVTFPLASTLICAVLDACRRCQAGLQEPPAEQMEWRGEQIKEALNSVVKHPF